MFNIIGAFDVPRYVYSVERKKFVPYVKLIIALMMSIKLSFKNVQHSALV